MDIVAVIAFNDAWVMSAWSKANGVKNDDIVSWFGVVITLCQMMILSFLLFCKWRVEERLRC